MNYCSNCGTKISADQVRCTCGEMLRPEATHHLQPWETETVFRARSAVKWARVAAVALSSIVVGILLVLSWPRLMSTWKTGGPPETGIVDPTSSQAETGPPTDLNNGNQVDVNQEGLFDFSKGQKLQPARTAAAVRVPREAPVKPSVAASTDAYDAQLLGDDSGETQKGRDARSLPDCKPATTQSLKGAEPRLGDNENSPLPKQSSVSYILGPRGGCYFVTAAGSKKYVDHSMCASSATAASRQD